MAEPNLDISLIIETLYPHLTKEEFEELMKKEETEVSEQWKKDFNQGVPYGVEAREKGEILDPKDADQLSKELLEDHPYGELPVQNQKAFADGILFGNVTGQNAKSQ